MLQMKHFTSFFLNSKYNVLVQRFFLLLKAAFAIAKAEGKINGEMEVTRRRDRRRKKLLNDLSKGSGYCHLKEEALFVGSFGRIYWTCH